MTSLESSETRLLLELKLRNNVYVTHIFNCLQKFSLTFFFINGPLFNIFFFFAEFFLQRRYFDMRGEGNAVNS